MKNRIVLFYLISIGLIAGFGCASKKKQMKKDKRKAAQERQQEREARAAEQARAKQAAAEAETEHERLRARIDKLEAKLEGARTLAENRKQLHDALRADLDSLVESGKVNITTRRGLLMVQIPQDVLFASGRFSLSSEGKQTLGSVASALGELEQHQILVAGHTDDIPVGKKSVNFQNNWELSTQRALSAKQVLVEAGLAKEKLAAAGFGQYDPIASNDSEESRGENRRVELMLIPDLSRVLKGPQTASK